MTNWFQIYIQESEKLFKDQYSFNNFSFKNKREKSYITCKDHGDFLQNFDKHLSSVAPSCPVCRLSYKRRREYVKGSIGSSQSTIDKVYRYFNNTFTVEDDLEIVETLNVKNFKVKYNCKICFSKIETTYGNLVSCKNLTKCCKKCSSSFSKRPSLVGDVQPFLKDYTFTLIDSSQPYLKKKSLLNIVCNKHPESPFIRSFEKFKSGQTCPICKFESSYKNGAFPGGYSCNYFENHPEKKDQKGYVYYIRFGNMYKIGISNNYKKRYNSLKVLFENLPSGILQVFETTLYDAYLIEQKILRDFKDYRIYTKASTELFKIDVLKNLSLDSFSTQKKES